MKQKSKLDYVVRVDLCIDAFIVIVGIIALLQLRGQIVEAYMYLENLSVFATAPIPVLIVVIFLSFFTDIIYIASKKPSFAVERYTVIWIILKIIGLAFFLLSLLIACAFPA